MRVARKSLAVLGVITVLIGASFFAGYEVAQGNVNIQQAFENAISNDISIGLTVKAYHQNGTLFATRYLPHDLILNNFNNWMLDLFDVGTSLPGRFCPSLSFGCIGTTGISVQGLACQGSERCGVVLEIGTSGTAPTRADTHLNSAYTPSGANAYFPDTAGNGVATQTANPAVCNSASTDSITGISGSQTITSSVTIQEVGLFLESWGTSNVADDINMMFHDTFTGIAVVNGDTVSISYEIDLNNSGFNDNFCNLLAGYFAGYILEGGHVQISLKNIAGASTNFYTWCASRNDIAYYPSTSTSCGSASAAGRIAIGTGSSAFAPTSVALTTQVGIATITQSAYLSPTAYWTTTITIGSSNTIQEAGIFLSLSGGSYMFFALTFSGQAQTASVPFGATIRMSD